MAEDFPPLTQKRTQLFAEIFVQHIRENLVEKIRALHFESGGVVRGHGYGLRPGEIPAILGQCEFRIDRQRAEALTRRLRWITRDRIGEELDD